LAWSSTRSLRASRRDLEARLDQSKVRDHLGVYSLEDLVDSAALVLVGLGLDLALDEWAWIGLTWNGSIFCIQHGTDMDNSTVAIHGYSGLLFLVIDLMKVML